MDHLLKLFALHCGLSLSQYWHLRLVLSVSLVPLLAVLYLVVCGWRRQRPPSYTLWVSHDGRLVARLDGPAPGPAAPSQAALPAPSKHPPQ